LRYKIKSYEIRIFKHALKSGKIENSNTMYKVIIGQIIEIMVSNLTLHSTTQHKITQHNTTQHNTTQHNTTQQTY
jgi:hypothetical protein